jgi:acylphosphatase
MPVEAPGAGSRRALLARVEGIVQGVGFRYCAAQTARALGLRGYVRNLPDGCVEVVAEGEEARLERLRAWLEKGPPGAYVRHLQAHYAPARGLYKSFTIEF